MGFYDEIAGEYGRIVNAGSRAQAAGRLADWLAAERRPRRALEAACGTGLYARVLAERGVDVVATDLSAAMLEQARSTPSPGPGRIEWVQATMQDAASRVAGPFDALLCMGNSLPHLLTEADLGQALSGFARLLSPAGLAVVQMLNYHRVLARGERFVGASRQGGREYIRFYDFLGELVQFNILELRWAERGKTGTDPVFRGSTNSPPRAASRGNGNDAESEVRPCFSPDSHLLHQTQLRPWRAEQAAAAFREAGFAKVELYGGLDRPAFDPQESEMVMIVATR